MNAQQIMVKYNRGEALSNDDIRTLMFHVIQSVDQLDAMAHANIARLEKTQRIAA